MRRLVAFLFDLMLISICTQIIGSNNIINKNYIKYEETMDSYINFNDKYLDAINTVSNIYSDDKVTKEEQEDFNIRYKELDIMLKNDYIQQDITQDIFVKVLNISNSYLYKLTKLNLIPTLLSIILTILYFGVIQYIFDGQTLGKKIFKLRVVNNDNTSVSLKNTITRTLLITTVISDLLSLCLLLINSKYYLLSYMIIYLIIIIIIISCIITMLCSKDNRGLHDKLCNTRVLREI